MKKRARIPAAMAVWSCSLILGTVLTTLPVLARGGSGSERRVQAGVREKLQAKLEALHGAGKFPGVTAGFVLADGTSFGLAAGVSDKTAGTRMTPRDVLLQGSVGKTYVAAIALQLVKAGRIDLDRKVEDYLGEEPWYPRLPNARTITVRMLMNHTSGLVRYEFDDRFIKDLLAAPGRNWKPAELVAYLLDQAPPFPAGEKWEYSDTNYIVLGMIIEKVAGRKYYDLLRERILGPFKLAETHPSEGRVIPGLVQGYAGAGNPFGGTDEMISGGRFVFNPQFEWTGGGIASTSEDLARWARILYTGNVLDPDMRTEMFKGVTARLGPKTQYGLGVIIRETPLGTSYGHSGYFPGYLTEMMYFPGRGIAVAVQVNTSDPRTLGRSLVSFIYELMSVLESDIPN